LCVTCLSLTLLRATPHTPSQSLSLSLTYTLSLSLSLSLSRVSFVSLREIFIGMTSRDNKKASSSRAGRIRTLSDLNRPSADSDSDSDGPQEYYTGGEKRFSSFPILLLLSSFIRRRFNFCILSRQHSKTRNY